MCKIMARSKPTSEELVRIQQDRKHGIKKMLAVMWTRSDHAKHQLKQQQSKLNTMKIVGSATY